DAAALERVQAEIVASGGPAVTVTADTTQLDQLEAARESIERQLGQIDVLVANTGGSLTRPGASMEELSEAEWRASVDANLTATRRTFRAVLPGEKARRRGVIIATASAAGRRPSERSRAPYTAARAGSERLAQRVATQAGPFGVRATCIAPETIL